MIELIKEYSSKADMFLLPLTGLTKNEKYEVSSYLFWKDYTIDNYQLILSFSYDNYNEFIAHCRKYTFPILDRNGYLVESYDIAGRSIFILDMSEWALDIQMFLEGKYSKFSKEAKGLIEEFHRKNKTQIPIQVYGPLYPTMKMGLLDGRTPIEYVAENYGFNKERMIKIGEVGGLYDQMSETMIASVEELCQNDT